MKRLFFLFLILAYFTLILFSNRSLYFSRFDASYWKDRYEHSQWQLPVSFRTIGDDGLYLYTGYRLTSGDNPTTINAEMPPLGKYLIGLSIIVFGNGYWFGLIITSLAIGVFFLLARTLQIHSKLSFAITLLFATDPLLMSQFPLTMLDSLQLLFLLLTFLFLLLLQKRHSLIFTIALGVSFGLFSGAKTPLFSPFLGIIIVAVLWKKGVKTLVLFLASAGLAYLAPYTQYFSTHSFADWLGVQKWMIGFYRTSLLSPNRGSALTTLLFNRTQNLFTHAWETGSQWSIAWPIVAIFALKEVWSAKRTYVPIILFSGLLLILLSVIPFWTRYLLLVLPLLYLSALPAIAKQKFAAVLFAILLLGNSIASFNILFPTPESLIKEFAYSWEHGFFSDMYEQLATASKTTSREAFNRFGVKTFADGQIESVNIDIENPQWSRFQSPQIVKLRLTYFTRELGPFTEKRTLSVVNENGRWVIQWEWKNLMEGLNENAHLETSVIPARRGSITSTNGIILASDVPGFMIWITPRQVDQNKEPTMLTQLEMAFNHHPGAVSIHQRYVGNSLPDIPVPIGVVATPPELYPGMTLTPHPARVPQLGVANTAYKECCSFLYSTTNYDGVADEEKQYNKQLKGKNGGSLILKDQNGAVLRTLLDVKKQDGTDVLLKF